MSITVQNNAGINIAMIFEQLAIENASQEKIDSVLETLFKTSYTKDFILYYASKGYGYHVAYGGLNWHLKSSLVILTKIEYWQEI